MNNNEPIRYAVIDKKNRREIVMLRGRGCAWKQCRFCDYHLDESLDAAANYKLNKAVLQNVTGRYGALEVINSGSFVDLDMQTMDCIESTCVEKGVKRLHFECHWLHREAVPALKARFAAHGVTVKIKTGVETFDYDFRETVMEKGISEKDPAKIAAPFDECCLLFGLTGQTRESMERDLALGLQHFERVCVNLMEANTAALAPDKQVLQTFLDELYPIYIQNDRVDILLANTDFGVGGTENAQ